MENHHQSPPLTDITTEATHILNLIKEVHKSYGTGYLISLLRGTNEYGWKSEEHPKLQYFGKLENLSISRIEKLLDVLIEQGYLSIKSPIYGNIGISAKGILYLKHPEKLEVSPRKLKTPWHEYLLLGELRNIRAEICKEQGCSPYEIFTNYTLRQLVTIRPQTLQELDQIPGMPSLPVVHKEQFLASIVQVLEKQALNEKDQIFSRAYSPAYREVKGWFESGVSVEEIAARKSLAVSTIRNYLEVLHQAGSVDLTPWIETQIDAQILHQGVAYFQQTQSPKLKEAHEVLGIAYDQLRLCRLYAQTIVTAASSS